MIKWTTPSLECCVPSELEYDYILFTLMQDEIVIERTVSQEQVQDGKFTLFFTQEETSQFKLLSPVEAQLNVMKGGVRIATNIETLSIDRNLHDEYIPPELPQLEITENGRYSVGTYLFVDVNVEGGDAPTGTIEITDNGTYDVTNYATANVEVEGGGTPYEGTYEVTPKVTEQVLPTNNRLMKNDLTVKEITYSVVDNEMGLTVQIGEI